MKTPARLQRPLPAFPLLLCPPKHTTRHYQLMLLALPNTVKLSHEFLALEIITAVARPGTEYSATAEGTIPTTYTRK